MNDLFQLWVYLAASPLLWLLVTVLAYLTGVWLFRISRSNPLFTPVLVGVVIVVSVLLATGTPYPVYFEGAKFVHFLIGPATVALAVPSRAPRTNDCQSREIRGLERDPCAGACQRHEGSLGHLGRRTRQGGVEAQSGGRRRRGRQRDACAGPQPPLDVGGHRSPPAA